ncbi:ribosomal protein S18-alanine N-acetyltransferase [Bowmanella sp. Y26]|uniref:ribosomal protein S18-alanine N-acetyltransferase n=1 Tax=Bowmanella yangjiangensis TaxID=2811230 RepID=UPI001BDD4E48|nr:ribosomal protein S18-alanine N-acetyltransferase [Bowmanella yangjiangensis]MBT1065739.1 ribosomal protein S18-alanine N-acetyltransferase [Bowmanella yangjiangensis]
MLNFLSLNCENYLPAFALQVACHSHPWSEATFASCLDGQYFAWQMEQSGELAGFYVGLQVLQEATLMDIGIASSYRGKGLSKPLLEHFFSQCRHKGINEVWLEVRASNQAAIGLYEHYGFVLIERRKNYYPTHEGREDALIMKLSWENS